jgi:4-hydroxy-tetrahydrodipicolinate reductase
VARAPHPEDDGVKVAIAGAQGRMGRLAFEAIQNEADLEYAGGFARIGDQSAGIYDNVEQLLDERTPDVIVDFTPRPVTQAVARAAVERGVSPVVGSSEWNADERAELKRLCDERHVGALIVPNFAIGAILMMNFAEQAARYFPSCEIVEMHRADKRDKPSGTASATAERIAAGGGSAGVPIHSVRMKGLLSHQEVLFSNEGELLTIRHDSFSSESFAGGIIAAIRQVRSLKGLEVGLKL